ncbi:MAG TPA: hypothetical protein VHU40_17620 [Polyangia bacterium]|jgi:hypothetical protein|nr:hypothetical protein [Polyangia bacterium]
MVKILALILALGAAPACWTATPIAVDFAPPTRAYRGAEYPAVYDHWTRHTKVVQDVDTALEVWATFKSDEFREAFVARYAEAYGLKEDAIEPLRRAQREAAAASYEFIVTAQSSNYKWNDLEKKSSPWRVTLRDAAGHEVSWNELKIEKLPDQVERAFYPVKTPFSKTYRVLFTRALAHDEGFVGERSGLIALRLAGPFGHADLVWQARSAERE